MKEAFSDAKEIVIRVRNVKTYAASTAIAVCSLGLSGLQTSLEIPAKYVTLKPAITNFENYRSLLKVFSLVFYYHSK